MSKSSCSKLHPERQPGPCIHCHQNKDRYIHLAQKKHSDESFFEYVHDTYKYSEEACICRGCEIQFRRKLKNPQNIDCDSTPLKKRKSDETSGVLCFLNNFDKCSEIGHHFTSISPTLVERKFGVNVQEQFPDHSLEDDFSGIKLCHIHYNALNNFKRENFFRCFVCKKPSTSGTGSSKKFVNITEEKVELFHKYLVEILDYEHEYTSSDDKRICCLTCYNGFNHFCRSNTGEDYNFQTIKYLTECKDNCRFNDPVNVENIDLYTMQQISDYVFTSFLNDEILMLPKLYERYKKGLVANFEAYNLAYNSELEHNSKWVLRMLKLRFNHAIKLYVPKVKQNGTLLYRHGTDLLNAIHSLKCKYDHVVSEKDVIENQLSDTRSAFISLKNKKVPKHEILNDAISILRKLVKRYTMNNTGKLDLQDLNTFNIHEEVNEVPPVLWNFLYRLSSTDSEDKEWLKNVNSWDNIYTHSATLNRLCPRLFICSSIFNCQNSQCVKPLHLLITDVFDKFSNSSSTFLSINARLGICVSKDSLLRYITNRCKQLEEQQRVITSNSFVIASFDNLDKNQAYSVAGAGKNNSGFHGTTIQTVTPCPSLGKIEAQCPLPKSDASGVDAPLDGQALPQNESMHSNESESTHTCKSESTHTCKSESTETENVSEKMLSRDRKLPADLVEKIINPENKVHEDISISENASTNVSYFENIESSFLDLSPSETEAFDDFLLNVNKYGFTKYVLQEKHIKVPGIKTFFSIPSTSTDKSEFTNIAILDETADKKETVIKVLNILHKAFQIGDTCKYFVIVGDGKSYDHLIKLKKEYGSGLSWVLPYPGDWHILKNLQPVFMKIYLDAGLKQLACKYHQAAKYKKLVECTQFELSHRFLLQAWEAILRYQIHIFISTTDNINTISSCTENFNQVIQEIFTNLDLVLDGDVACNDKLFSEICCKKFQLFAAFTDDLLTKFHEWRKTQCELSDTFMFWDTFVHVDIANYMALYFAIRTRNWALRNASLKQLACLFHAFDRCNYLRMIPHHLADLQTFPKDVLDFFEMGCFSASFSGEDYYSVALDECHEMQINLKTKNALNSLSQSSLAKLTFYLPYRAETIHNFKKELGFQRDMPHHTEKGIKYVSVEEETILEYFSKLEQSTLFMAGDKKTLHHIFLNIDASDEQTDSLMNYRRYGQEDLVNYVNCYLKVSGSKKIPPRRRRNLKTFSAPKVTVSKQKKEIKDNKTVMSCLRKKIAFSKFTNRPILDLDQFIQLPRAICDENGNPETGQKSSATAFFKKLYPDVVILQVSTIPYDTAFIIDGMFIIHTVPLSVHHTFADYATCLFETWVVAKQKELKLSEVHFLFDHPNRSGISPKDIERLKRDGCHDQVSEFGLITADTPLPSNWEAFLQIRQQKRNLVNFLSQYFLQLACVIYSNVNFYFVTAGGFDNEHKDKALLAHKGKLKEFCVASGNHEEADSRVWLHCLKTNSANIIIYSPDTDVYFIGLPLISNLEGKMVYVQLRESVRKEDLFIDMVGFCKKLKQNDPCLKGIPNIEVCIQLVYIFSGCDYVSYFKGLGKKTFFDAFRRYVTFILGTNPSFDLYSESGLHAFYRLVVSAYFIRNSTAFLPYTSPKALFDSLTVNDIHEKHLKLLLVCRETLWERIVSEQDMIPNAEALRLHWLRCFWVFQFWSNAGQNVHQLSNLSEFGWKIDNGILECLWDSESNLQKVKKTVEWYTKGCACKTGCTTKRCKCKKSNDGYCGPGCNCINCKNIMPADKNLTISEGIDDTLSEESDLDTDFFDSDDDSIELDDSDIVLHQDWDVDLQFLASDDLYV